MSNPFGAAGGAYVRKWPSLAEYGHFWGLWSPPVPFFGGPEGPNRSPWMCLTMSNLVQPMSNPFEAAGGAYVRKWPSLSEFGHFLAKNGSKMVKFDGR